MDLAELAAVLAEAERIVEPDESERRRVAQVSERVLSACREKFLGRNGVTAVSIEGSVAKDTWVRGRAEVDVFVHFKVEVGREVLETTVLDVGREVLEELQGRHWLRYASHPYLEGELDGVRVNIVGCFDVGLGRWISPVDRTPYHTALINSRLTPELRKEVRLFKGFLMGCGLYGAEIEVEGFSGYLSELLIINYGGLMPLLRSAAEWRIPIFIDMTGKVTREEALRLFPQASLIFIDPVDPSRNVAAAVSKTKLAEMILASKLFIKRPSLKFFKLASTETSERPLSELLDREILGILFKVDETRPPDILWGEVKHTLRGISRRLEKEGFRVFRAGATISGDEALILYELSSLALPRAELRVGPPVWMDNAIDFIEKTLRRSERMAGPWVEGERLYALLRREVVRADELLRGWMRERQVAISNHLLKSIEGAEILTSTSGLVERVRRRPELMDFLREFINGIPPPIRHFERIC